jgi:hypothetical protein
MSGNQIQFLIFLIFLINNIKTTIFINIYEIRRYWYFMKQTVLLKTLHSEKYFTVDVHVYKTVMIDFASARAYSPQRSAIINAQSHPSFIF